MISGIASVVAVLLSCLPLAGSEPIDETNGSVTDVAELVCDESFEPILLSGRVVFESGEPAVGSVVSIELRKRGSTERQTARIVTSDDGRFRARIRVEPEILVATPILAESADGQLAGMFGFASNRDIGRQERVEIRLANFRKLSVLVTDNSGAGIQGARVAVCTGLPFYTKAGSTNSDGVATIQVPANCRIEQVVAWSDAQGLDYRLLQPSPDENVAGNVPPADLFPTNQLTLKLEGAVPVSFKVVDQQGQPLVGAMVRPWLLRRDSASGFLNCSGFGSELTTLTDAQGTTEFPWFPAWQKQNVVVWPSHPGFVRKRVVFQPDDVTGVQEIVLTRLVPIRGTVRYADGKPAKNIRLTAD
ncbi:MAG: hypothetical protein JNM43_29520, partial [Planctomycetaceae bacterium]|nr:hypothetical protein [Planctomycetaceae bacterium]